VREHPDVKLRIVEGYSGLLTERVLAEDLHFAIVPTFEGRVGLRSRLLARDREMLLSGPARGFAPLEPLRLADCTPLRLVGAGLPHNPRSTRSSSSSSRRGARSACRRACSCSGWKPRSRACAASGTAPSPRRSW